MRLTITASRLLIHGRLTGPRTLHVHDGRIAAIDEAARPRDGTTDVVLEDGVLSAGMVDLQVNGAVGVDLAAADAAGWRAVADHLAAHGVTAFCPTFITAPLDDLRAAVAMTAEQRAALAAATTAQVLGAHVEGPFLSPARPGAHDPQHLREPDAAAVDALLDGPGGAPAIVTLAPELRGALAAIERLVGAGVAASLGHSDATAEQALAAVDAGARLATHLFNAMRPFGHREPGVAGHVLVDDRVTSGLIVDGHHVADDAVRLALRAAAGRIALVSDAVAAAGMAPGPFHIGPVLAHARADGPPRLQDGTLAGSALHLDEAVRGAVALGATPEQALDAATRVPAAALGATKHGRLTPGARADLVWWDPELRVRAVWIAGERLDPTSAPSTATP